jgi:hypothetical protein
MARITRFSIPLTIEEKPLRCIRFYSSHKGA